MRGQEAGSRSEQASNLRREGFIEAAFILNKVC
jgi:hypothetical protein